MNKNENIGELKKRIEACDVTIGVIGLGYVGLPLAVEFAGKGIRTFGIDIDTAKIESLKSGKNYIEDISDELVKKVIGNGLLTVTTDFDSLGECDALFICVPTPFTANKDPDISYIIDAAMKVSHTLKKNQVVILKSTTFPGTTEKYVRPLLESSGLKAGEDFFLAFSPERIDPGNKVWTTSNTPIVVGGIDEISTELACAFQRLAVSEVVPVSTPAVAEMEKLLENIYRSVNISLVNELAQLCDRIGINIWEVIEAASTKPFGFMPFYPGPGIGGHCILIDPYYLAWMAREHDFVTKFITLAAEINEDMPFYVRAMVIKEIAKQEVTLKTAKVLILGMAFKKDVNDLRHSPALKVAELLMEEEITNISYYDPYIPEIELEGNIMKSEPKLTAALLGRFDIVLITTDHSVFDFELIAKSSKVVIDTRNACKNIKSCNIILLGDGK